LVLLKVQNYGIADNISGNCQQYRGNIERKGKKLHQKWQHHDREIPNKIRLQQFSHLIEAVFYSSSCTNIVQVKWLLFMKEVDLCLGPPRNTVHLNPT
jgi:hypothetical protein